MKRFLALLIALTTALAFTGCAFTNNLTAYGLYSKAQKTIEKAGGCEADIKMKVSFDFLEELMSMDMEYNVKQNGESTKTVAVVEGEEITTTIIDGKTLYMEAGGEKIKFNIPEDSDVTEESLTESEMLNLSEELFEDIVVIKNDDGTKEVVLLLDSENLGDSVTSLLGDMGDMEGVTFENITYAMKFDKKNNLTSAEILFVMVMDILGTEIKGDISMECTFINFGEAPEIVLNYPEGEYEDGGEYTEDIAA